ncbi:MAG TPA: MFS transporter [Streptosporangiaceae bacterium]|nr:MFS transporter [Streptosporangiaceae bacterium]
MTYPGTGLSRPAHRWTSAIDGPRLRDLRRQQGLTREQLASRDQSRPGWIFGGGPATVVTMSPEPRAAPGAAVPPPDPAAAPVSTAPGAAAPGARAGRSRIRFAGLGYALTVLLTGTNLATPLYATYQRVFGLTPLDVTLLVAVYAAAVVVALLICGPLSDTAGYRPVLIAGLVAAACGAALLAAASGPGWLFAGRAVQGLAVGTCSGALTAGLVLTEPSGRRARASFLAATATTAACGAGPVLAGALAQFAPAPRALSYLVEISLLIPALAAAAMLPASLGASGGRWRPRWPRPPAAIRGEFLLPAVVSLLAWAVAYVVLALVPSYAAATLGRSNLLVDGSAAGSLLLVAAAAQAACRRWDAGRAQAAGLLGLTAGLLGLIAAGRLGSATVLFAAMAIAGGGQGLAFMGGVRRINEIAPADGHAGTVAMFYVVTYTGSGLVTAGVGLLATHLGLSVAVQLSGAVLAAACLVTLAAARHRGIRGAAAAR